MNLKTIAEAVNYTLKMNNKPMDVEEIYKYIICNNLYIFKSNNPMHVLKSTISKHCINSESKLKAKDSYYRITDELKYILL